MKMKSNAETKLMPWSVKMTLLGRRSTGELVTWFMQTTSQSRQKKSMVYLCESLFSSLQKTLGRICSAGGFNLLFREDVVGSSHHGKQKVINNRKWLEWDRTRLPRTDIPSNQPHLPISTISHWSAQILNPWHEWTKPFIRSESLWFNHL